jgi:heme/copper-type cytochrome/quinol oxidase subunit 3
MTTFIEQHEKQKLREQREAEIRLKNNRLGMTIFQVSWIMAFVAIIVVNWQLRYSYAEWPPAGVEPFSPILPTIATLGLIASSWLVHNGLKVLREAHVDTFLNNWRYAIGLGFAFIAVIVYEFFTVSDAAMATQYGETFRLMTGFHFVHALVIVMIMINVFRKGKQGIYTGDEHDSWAVEGTAKLWHFVTAAWLLFYIVLYWIP